ncbi:MAG TPA: hypothetical protein VGX92_01325 [Pyrinomonadaceae bacterium]|jgi:hypothetical protein|nr:hypothetical protein [Pyrinomonadaceae bacterium]
MRSLEKPSRRRRRRAASLEAVDARRAAGDEAASASLLSWEEVNRTHRIQSGVYQRGGRLISLLTDFGRINPCYPDRQDEAGETIYYTGDGRRGDQYLNPGNRALLAAIESGHAVPLFNKLAVGRWQHMGYWRVTDGRQRYDEVEKRMLWIFTLRRARR